MQQSGQFGIGGEAALSGVGHLVLRVERACVEIVLQQAVGDDHVAHTDPIGQSARHACEQQRVATEFDDQAGGRCGCCHLADAAQHQRHLPAPQRAQRIVAIAVAHPAGDLQGIEQRLLLLRNGADDAQSLHGCGAHAALPAENRRHAVL
ncbi:hypothetical protein GALL_430480 [mine drainage metagenome]|uniref:Uncharacterized protein n=1 Tax=mine drainage metagenome TaxID=410659 RepID=A0A1J5PW08_9ZZZZ